MEYILLTIILGVLLLQEYRQRKLNKKNLILSIENNKSIETLKELQKEVINLQDDLGGEREKNRELLSQKKSSETRLGNIGENLIPFLENCPYNPRDLHFLGNPIDFVCFDFDQGEITFLEVKTGNSKPSKRQKIVKNIIKSGRVFYSEIRINEKGVKHRRMNNTDMSNEIEDTDEQN